MLSKAGFVPIHLLTFRPLQLPVHQPLFVPSCPISRDKNSAMSNLKTSRWTEKDAISPRITLSKRQPSSIQNISKKAQKVTTDKVCATPAITEPNFENFDPNGHPTIRDARKMANRVTALQTIGPIDINMIRSNAPGSVPFLTCSAGSKLLTNR